MLKSTERVLSAGGRRIPLGLRTLIMGVVNVTPDSFSGDGVLNCNDALRLAAELVAAGADIIDIGGESTRPGYEPVNEAQEYERIEPVLAALGGKSNAIISVDTTKAAIFRSAWSQGAGLLNSTKGADSELMVLAAELSCPFVIMHNKDRAEYSSDVVDDVLKYLDEGARKGINLGLQEEQIILDPGIGFGKNADHNIALMRSLERITRLGFPTMIGTSRKSTIGKVTGRPVDGRIHGTAATVALAIAAGVDIVRVHDVAAMLDVVKMSDTIVRDWRPEGWQQ